MLGATKKFVKKFYAWPLYLGVPNDFPGFIPMTSFRHSNDEYGGGLTFITTIGLIHTLEQRLRFLIKATIFVRLSFYF